jgi:beta-lactamase class A
MIDRRALLAGLAAVPFASAGKAQRAADHQPAFEALRARLGPGGRLGVAALTGRGSILFDPDSRYAMASTFKLALAGCMLAGAEHRLWAMADELPFGEADLLDHAPVVRANLARGRLSIETLCAAVVEVSDNSAANLLLRRIGGPAALTAFVRRCGDPVTRLDRYEVALNSNLPGDPRDTTSPRAMVRLMWSLLFGSALAPASRARLLGWMEGATTGLGRLRAGLPAGWRVGDKTGNGANGAANDLAFALPPGGAAILIACYTSGGNAPTAVRDEVHASVARLVAASAN